jgi:tRNA(adenine34) deaminase
MATPYYSENDTNDSNPDLYFMKQALMEAQKAGAKDEVPIGAVIVCQGRIIARGYNLTETLTDVTAHAEMQAITAAAQFLGGKYLINCTLYVTVEPCVMCAGALGWSQISKIVYGTKDDKRGFTRFAPNALHPKTEVVEGLMAEECSKLMKEFFIKKRNKENPQFSQF